MRPIPGLHEEEHFRWRGGAVSRLEGLSDAVFALADRISVMVYGRLIATGSPAEVKANEEVRQAYLGEAA